MENTFSAPSGGAPGKPKRKVRGPDRYGGLLHGLGTVVRAHRMERGLSRRELADRGGLSPRFLADLEAGRGNISVGKLADLARTLDLPLALLFAGIGNSQPPIEDTPQTLRSKIGHLVKEASPAVLRQVAALLNGGPGKAGRPHPVIALMGLRGAGKSTLGPLLAEGLGLPFRELDDLIQDVTGLALQEIFELHGESAYRAAERQALETLVEQGSPVVVAVSGGIVNDPHSFLLLRERTLLVWLKTAPRQHMKRVLTQGDRRPVRGRSDAMAELRSLLKRRAPLYEQARVVIDTSRDTKEVSAQRLLEEVGRAMGGRP